MDRRSFLQSLGITAVAGFAFNCADSSDKPMESTAAAKAGLGLSTVALQLYSVRHIINDDFERVIRMVAETGYKELELAGFHNLTASQIRTIMDDVQVTAPATHLGANVFRDGLDQAIEDGNTLGHKYLICPHPGDLPYKTVDDYKAMADFFNEVGAKVKEAGMQFAYHNHEFEFEAIDGVIPMDILLENTDPELVKVELDLCWINFAKQDPIAFFEKYPGRTHLCHVKDMTAGGDMTTVGKGDIDFASILAQRELAGLKHFVVEHDNPEDPEQFIKDSFAHVTG